MTHPIVDAMTRILKGEVKTGEVLEPVPGLRFELLSPTVLRITTGAEVEDWDLPALVEPGNEKP